MSDLNIRYIGGPTAILEIGGVRLLTDPTFDAPGDYPIGQRVLVKTAGPSLGPDDIGLIDAVLLSHDQHPDNLDHSGRTYVASASLVLSTNAAAQRLGEPVQALPVWDSVDIEGVRITAVPAQHGPDGSLEVVGEVTGFILEGVGLPKVYISGDNASLDVVRSIADRFGAFDVAVLFVGAARTPLMPADFLTLTSALAAEAAQILEARQVVPLHFEQWAHFTEGSDALAESFTHAGLRDRLHLLEPGQQIEL